jgi:NAD(P)-dependent dehydrogenase (short-subunit alcohol dehydrogenase family)
MCPGWFGSLIGTVAKRLGSLFTKRLQPIGRIGKPEEVAAVEILFRASEGASWATGANIMVDSRHITRQMAVVCRAIGVEWFAFFKS